MALYFVKVDKDGYLPKGLTIQSRYSQRFFTAEIPDVNLEGIKSDPLVLKVELTQALKPNDGRAKFFS